VVVAQELMEKDVLMDIHGHTSASLEILIINAQVVE